MKIETIGKVNSCFKQKFGAPRQSGIVTTAEARIEIAEAYQDLDWWRGIEDWSYLWIVFGFHLNHDEKSSPLARIPRSEGKLKKGIFATRTPFRPNSLGLSLVKLVEFCPEEHCLKISGHDLVDGTPVFDIKPYAVEYDYRKDAMAPDWFYDLKIPTVEIVWPLEISIGIENRRFIEQVLQQDPRPAQLKSRENSREFKMSLGQFELVWKRERDTIYILELTTVPVSSEE